MLLFRFLRGFASSDERLREPLARRATSIIVALGLEALLLLALLTLGRTEPPPGKSDVTVVQLINADPDQAPKAEPTKAATEFSKAPLPQPPKPEVAKPMIKPAVTIPLIQLSHDEMAAADLSKLPAHPRGKMGPPDTGTPGDSERVSGSGPNGEPLYAAAWYREPYNDELSGYLSTAQGPGWALIACKTVADFRVDNCIGLDEAPAGSNIERAVLAAAWQFRVRPPRIGGESQVGAWVRIRIDYTIKRST